MVLVGRDLPRLFAARSMAGELPLSEVWRQQSLDDKYWPPEVCEVSSPNFSDGGNDL